MKKVYLIRHAKSSWDDPELEDIDRPLNDRGRHDAPMMAKLLKARHVRADVMISSPAARALSTCVEFARALGFAESKILVVERLYHAEEKQLLSVIRELNTVSEPESVMLFGHNPGLTEFTNRLLDDTIENIPTCGVVAAELNIQSWREAHWGCGKREFFDFPKRGKER